MAPEQLQALADATETDATQRYDRRRRFVALLADAIRRAEALIRLESELDRSR